MIETGFFGEDITLLKEQYQLKETIVTIIADNASYIQTAKKEIQKCRKEIEQFIEKNEEFEFTLRPFNCSKEAPKIIQRMCKSSRKFNIGPMSTVAGIIAEFALKSMISKGAKNAIVDNGGDIALISEKTVRIGIYTGNHNTRKLAFKILPKNKIIGICTSSGLVGHSFSFGNADATIVFSENVSLADAAATALGNLVRRKSNINGAFKILNNIAEINGAAVFIDDKIGLWGDVPEIIAAKVPYRLITKGAVL